MSECQRSLLLAGVLLTVSVLPESLVSQQSPVTVASVEGVTEYLLDNGLRVLLYPDPSQARTTVSVTYLVGSRHEDNGETGMAHLLEHMLFMGTPNHPEIVADFARRGALSNAITSPDRTHFFETFASSDENLRWALTMEADRMVNSILDESSLRSQLTVVRNEAERGQNSPAGVTRSRLMESAFSWHGYGRTTIGAASDLAGISAARLRAFYHRYYQPDNAIVIVAGQFDPEGVIGVITETLGQLPRPDRVGELALRAILTVEPAQDGERTVAVRRVGNAPMIIVGWHIPQAAAPEMASVEVLAEVLGAPSTGRLFRGVALAGVGASISATAVRLREPGMLLAQAVVRRQDNPRLAADAIVRVVEALRTGLPPTVTEVNRARQSVLSRIEREMADQGTAVARLSEWAGNGDWRLLFVHRDRVREVSPVSVQQVARKYLSRSNMTAAFFFPDSVSETVVVPPTPNIAEMVTGYSGDSISTESVATFVPDYETLESATTRTTLPGGVRLAMLPKDSRGGMVTVQMSFQFGDPESLKGKSPAALLAGQMLMRGTERLSRSQLRDTVSAFGGRVAISGGLSRVGGSVTVPREQLPAALRLAAEIMREPRFDPAEFALVQEAYLAALDRQRSDPQARAVLALQRQFSPRNPTDSRYLGTIDEQVAAIESVTLDQVRDFHSRFYGASRGEIAVVGDFAADSLRGQLIGLFSSWKSLASFQRLGVVTERRSPLDTTIITPDRPNAVMAVGWHLDIGRLDPDYPAMVLADAMLAGGSLNSRLPLRLRREEGLSYQVQSQLVIDEVDSVGQWLLMAIHPPAEVARVEAALKSEIRRAIDEGFLDGEVALARDGWLARRRLERSSDPVLAAQLNGQLRTGGSFDNAAQLEASMAEVDGVRVKRVVEQHLDLGKMSIVRSGDYRQ